MRNISEWTFFKYPRFRAFNIMTAFILGAISVGIISAFSIESQAYFVRMEDRINKITKYERENDMNGIHYHPGKNIISTDIDPCNYKMVFHRAIRVSIVSACISLLVYLLMYFIFGFGGGMVAMKTDFTLFSP